MTHAPKIHIFSSCVNLIREMKDAIVEVKRDGSVTEELITGPVTTPSTASDTCFSTCTRAAHAKRIRFSRNFCGSAGTSLSSDLQRSTSFTLTSCGDIMLDNFYATRKIT